MNTNGRSASLIFVLGCVLGAGCGDEGAVAAKGAIDAAADAAKVAVDELAKIDLSALSAESLRATAVEATVWLVARLEEVRDSETAREVAAAVEPVLERIVELAERMGDELPSRTELAGRVSVLRERFADDAGVRGAIGDLLDRLAAALQ